MIKRITQYIKYQFRYLLFLVLTFVLPLGLFFQFSPYQAPKVSYVVLGLLFLTQYVFFKEKDYRHSQKKTITALLARELEQTPSLSQVISRTTEVIRMRGVSLIICALLILWLMLSFKAF